MAAQTTDAPAAPAVSAPLKPEECAHPAAVIGVMAHEYAHYEGAVGPEGLRRTATYYGPVIGGLPISAWHCESCGLLRLDYPDGRTEERRLHPGPQPDLIAVATPFDPEVTHYGMQARVSGLTVQPRVYAELNAPYEGTPWTTSLRSVPLPQWSFLMWFTMVGLSVVSAGLLVTGVLAVYDYKTPEAIGPVINITGWMFFAVLAMQILAAGQRHWFPMPAISPAISTTQRAAPAVDASTAAVLTLLTLTIVGLFLAAILAVYTYSTSPAEGPVVVVTTFCATAAAAILIGGAIARRLRKRH